MDAEYAGMLKPQIVNTRMIVQSFVVMICIIIIQPAFPESPADTSYLNHMLQMGNRVYQSDPDSALYYYGLIIQHYDNYKVEITNAPSDLKRAAIELVIRAMNKTGNIFYYNDEYNRSAHYYKMSLELSKAAGLKEYTGRSLYDLGYTHYVKNEFNTAVELFNDSYIKYTEAGIQEGMFDALQACGLAQQHLGNNALADSCYRRAFQLATALNDSSLIADVRLHNGILLCEEGNLEEGTRFFEEALRIYESQGDQRAVSLAWLNLGVVMKMIGEYDKALLYMVKSTEIEEARQQKSQLVIRYYNLADLLMEMGEHDRAFEYCRRISLISGEIGTRPFQAEFDFLQGKYYYHRGNYNEAGRFFTLANDHAVNNDNLPLSANILVWQSKNYLGRENPAEAVIVAMNAFELAERVDMLALKKDAAEMLAASYERAGNAVAALQWFKRFREYSDSLNLHQQYQEIRRIEARYNFQEKERENELLRNRASLQEQKLRNRNVISIALVSVVALSLVIIILLYKRSRDARLLYQQQQQLNLRHLEELEQELDGKNRELTSKTMFLNQKNDLITRLIRRLQEIRDNGDNSSEEIVSIVNELRADSPQSSWKEFETQFIQVHPDFYQKLYELHPHLTSYEQRMCAFLRMNLNTKEIASITGRTAKSIEVTRSRIRSKLNLSRHDNLSSFLAAI